VLIKAAAGARCGCDDYLEWGCGVGRAGTLHLTRQGVRVVGTDAWSWDAPFSFTRARFAREGDPSIIWEGHFAGSTIPYCQIEKLANLERLPARGFTVISLPVKVHRASGGWARPIALIEA
jgi:kynurenine formamidase